MVRTLIVNADDLGICRSTNLAIAHAAREGIVTSASLMANMDAIGQVGNLSANTIPPDPPRRLGLGVHLCLSSGRPLLGPRDVPLLVDGDGFFHRGFIGLFRLVHSQRADEALEQIERELAAQTERLESLGFELDHVDSHQHVHMIPQIFRIAAALAAARGIAIRVADEPLLLPDREPACVPLPAGPEVRKTGDEPPRRPREIHFLRRFASGGLLPKGPPFLLRPMDPAERRLARGYRTLLWRPRYGAACRSPFCGRYYVGCPRAFQKSTSIRGAENLFPPPTAETAAATLAAGRINGSCRRPGTGCRAGRGPRSVVTRRTTILGNCTGQFSRRLGVESRWNPEVIAKPEFPATRRAVYPRRKARAALPIAPAGSRGRPTAAGSERVGRCSWPCSWSVCPLP